MQCSACGTENRPGSRFCDNCGAALASRCPGCGDPNRPDARFCASCGRTLRTDVPAIAARPAPAAPATAERRVVSVLFSDQVGFTSFAEDRDPEAVRDLLSRYFDVATQIVQRHGGTVEKFIGDAVMAVWGTPVAHEDDAERAVRAALEIVAAVATLQPSLQARAAVMTGEAAVTLNAENQGMVAGDLVNTAARLQGVAEPGTVLVGEVTMRSAERAIVFEPLGDHSLKGKTAPVPAWRALRVVAALGGQGRADALEAPFVGRDEELRQLKEHLHAVGREGRPRLVSITGPAGIGKSRLIWELEKYVDGITEDVWWHRGRSPSYGEGITFWALGEMVRRRAGLAEDDDEPTTRARITATVDEFVADPSEAASVASALLPLLGLEAAPAGGRDALFPAWRTLFERIAERGTTVLVFEDLQWADAGLLDFIDHLLDWSRSLPILIVTLARPELFDRRPDWGAARRSFTAMAVVPLPPTAMRELLVGLIPGAPESTVAAIADRADGVPLYAVEMVRALLSQGKLERVGDEYRPVGALTSLTVPESLRSLIASRLDALDPEERATVQAASVLGHVFAAPALAAVAGASESEIEPRLRNLARRELIELETDPASPERGQYKFMQSLIREVAHGTMGRRERRALHLAAARHFEVVGDEELAGALASHYLEAHRASEPGPEADALAAQARIALRSAAERAAGLGAHEQAVAQLERALSVTSDARERAELLRAAGVSAGMAAAPNASDYAARAVEAYRELGDPVEAARAIALHGRLLTDASDLEGARAALETALAEIPEGALPDIEAELAAHLSRVYMRTGRNDEALAMADRALAIGEPLDLDDVVVEALVNKGSALIALGRRRESNLLLEGAVRLSRGSDVGREMRARHNLAMSLVDDEPARGMEELAATRDLARRVGDESTFIFVTGTLAFFAAWTGIGLDEHATAAGEALESSAIRGDRLRLYTTLATIRAMRGERLDETLTELDEGYGDTTDPEEIWFRDTARAEVRLAKGEFDEAYRIAMAASEIPTQLPEVSLRVAVRAAAGLRDLERARSVLDRTRSLPIHGLPGRATLARDRGIVAALEGRRSDAVAEFVSARETLRRTGHELEFARFAVDAATVLPDEPQVAAWVTQGRPILERARARSELDRLDRLIPLEPRPAEVPRSDIAVARPVETA